MFRAAKHCIRLLLVLKGSWCHEGHPITASHEETPDDVLFQSHCYNNTRSEITLFLNEVTCQMFLRGAVLSDNYSSGAPMSVQCACFGWKTQHHLVSNSYATAQVIGLILRCLSLIILLIVWHFALRKKITITKIDQSFLEPSSLPTLP